MSFSIHDIGQIAPHIKERYRVPGPEQLRNFGGQSLKYNS
jgi:hypothetical protein